MRERGVSRQFVASRVLSPSTSLITSSVTLLYSTLTQHVRLTRICTCMLCAQHVLRTRFWLALLLGARLTHALSIRLAPRDETAHMLVPIVDPLTAILAHFDEARRDQRVE